MAGGSLLQYLVLCPRLCSIPIHGLIGALQCGMIAKYALSWLGVQPLQSWKLLWKSCS